MKKAKDRELAEVLNELTKAKGLLAKLGVPGYTETELTEVLNELTKAKGLLAKLGVPVELFSLQGPNYFTKKSKVPAGDWSLNPAGVDWLRSNSKLDHVLSRPDNRVMDSLRSSKTPEKSSKTFILAINLQVTGRDHHSAVFYFSSKVDEPMNPTSLLYQFIHEFNTFRDSRFNIVNKIVSGPWLVKTTVKNYYVCVCVEEINGASSHMYV
ncbi:protein of unknown function-containing protein [Forsythia ovata]|uniref:Protein ENHANCED DISEASE RESISTANCE 2 C-terminal domain-containing protein n=1 Tax=Forsythia ovata TaxID=205694 RepID=A0ABD1W5Q6_9LAMI